MTDAHCHVFFHQFDEDREAVLQRALDNNIRRMILVNCDQDYQETLFSFVAANASEIKMKATLGVHPTHFTENDVNDPEHLRIFSQWLRKMYEEHGPLIAAVGETGLDFFHPHDKSTQEAYFRAQLDFARETSLPVVLHIRDAFADTFRVLSEYTDVSTVFHCFSGGMKEWEHIREKLPNAMLSFTGIITYPKSEELRAVVGAVDQNRFMVETDCPFLAPQPERGKRNEPSFVIHTARQVAECKGISYEEVEKITDENVERFFCL